MVRSRLVFGAFVVALGLAVPAHSKRAPGPPVPPGWTIDTSAQGDLTGDGIADTALVIRQLNPAKVIKNDGLGVAELDTNSRRLLVFERLANGTFRQIAQADRMIPSAGSKDTPCLEDPLAEGGISIERNVLSVELHHWLSCGSWGVSMNTYKFRREGTRFRMIGFDHTEFMRNSGEGEKVSINFLTGRKGTSPYSIDESLPVRWRWSKVRPQRFYLESINLDACPAIDARTYLC